MSRTVQLRDAKALEVTTRSGHLLAIAEPDRVDVEIDGLSERARRRQVWREHGRLHIRGGRGSSAVTIRCPPGTDLVAATNSGRLELRGDFGDVRLHTHSGRIQVERARSVKARTKSGGIGVDHAHGRVSAAVVSGSVDIKRARSARAMSVSGQVKLSGISGRVEAMSVNGGVHVSTDGAGDIRVETVSGSVDISTDGAGDILVRTVSGSAEISIPRGYRPRVRARQKSGSLKVDCEPGDDLTITVATVSGSVNVGTHR